MKCSIESKFQKGAVLVITCPQFPNNPPEKLKIVDVKLISKGSWWSFSYLCEMEDRSRTWYKEDIFDSDFTVEEIKS